MHAMRTALTLSVLAALSAPAFADCAGHVSADAKTKPVVTADTKGGPVAPDEKKG